MGSYFAIGLVAAITLQVAFMFVDEFYFHEKRRLGPWEAWGHPVDSIVMGAVLLIPAFAPVTKTWLLIYVVGAALSCLCVTKDEWVHKQESSAAENWLHSLLFMLHPVIFIFLGFVWAGRELSFFRQLLPFSAFCFAGYQALRWGVFGKRAASIDNAFYDHLGKGWYEDDCHPVALLRAESVKKLEYLYRVFERESLLENAKILDVGCGAGFLANPLAEKGYQVTGLDFASGALEVAKEQGTANFVQGDAHNLSFKDGEFDAVLLLDFLEHTENPAQAIQEAARVLKPDGLMVVHTFNRTPLANILAVYGVRYFSRGGPKHVHIYSLFIKPTELNEMAVSCGLTRHDLCGIAPKVGSWAFLSSVLKRRVHPAFKFRFTKSVSAGYLSYFVKATV